MLNLYLEGSDDSVLELTQFVIECDFDLLMLEDAIGEGQKSNSCHPSFLHHY